MKTVQVEFFCCISGIFLDCFQKFLEMFKSTKTTGTPPIIFLRYLFYPEQFFLIFSVALTNKKVRAVESRSKSIQIGPSDRPKTL